MTPGAVVEPEPHEPTQPQKKDQGPVVQSPIKLILD